MIALHALLLSALLVGGAEAGVRNLRSHRENVAKKDNPNDGMEALDFLNAVEQQLNPKEKPHEAAAKQKVEEAPQPADEHVLEKMISGFSAAARQLGSAVATKVKGVKVARDESDNGDSNDVDEDDPDEIPREEAAAAKAEEKAARAADVATAQNLKEASQTAEADHNVETEDDPDEIPKGMAAAALAEEKAQTTLEADLAKVMGSKNDDQKEASQTVDAAHKVDIQGAHKAIEAAEALAKKIQIAYKSPESNYFEHDAKAKVAPKKHVDHAAIIKAAPAAVDHAATGTPDMASPAIKLVPAAAKGKVMYDLASKIVQGGQKVAQEKAAAGKKAGVEKTGEKVFSFKKAAADHSAGASTHGKQEVAKAASKSAPKVATRKHSEVTPVAKSTPKVITPATKPLPPKEVKKSAVRLASDSAVAEVRLASDSAVAEVEARLLEEGIETTEAELLEAGMQALLAKKRAKEAAAKKAAEQAAEEKEKRKQMAQLAAAAKAAAKQKAADKKAAEAAAAEYAAAQKKLAQKLAEQKKIAAEAEAKKRAAAEKLAAAQRAAAEKERAAEKAHEEEAAKEEAEEEEKDKEEQEKEDAESRDDEDGQEAQIPAAEAKDLRAMGETAFNLKHEHQDYQESDEGDDSHEDADTASHVVDRDDVTDEPAGEDEEFQGSSD